MIYVRIIVGKYLGIVKETSNDYNMQYNQQYTAEDPAMSSYANDAYRPPTIPQYTKPLFPAVIRQLFFLQKKIQ